MTEKNRSKTQFNHLIALVGSMIGPVLQISGGSMEKIVQYNIMPLIQFILILDNPRVDITAR